tara:strand:+ start:323 stop:781 length:459 start_codon:yes stop_codon:yes gene_type:complete
MDILKAIGVIDLTLVAIYAMAIRCTVKAVVPSIAFILTITLSFVDIPQDVLHVAYAAVYLLLVPFATTKIAYGMLAYAVGNAVTVGYLISSFWLESFALYFAIEMTVLNLVILITIFKGFKNGQLDNVDRIVLFSALDLLNLQAHTKTDTRR